MNPDTDVHQVAKATSSGYNEIVLTGIHLGAYGRDLKYKVRLSELLVTILKQTTIQFHSCMYSLRRQEQKRSAHSTWQHLIAGKKLYI